MHPSCLSLLDCLDSSLILYYPITGRVWSGLICYTKRLTWFYYLHLISSSTLFRSSMVSEAVSVWPWLSPCCKTKTFMATLSKRQWVFFCYQGYGKKYIVCYHGWYLLWSWYVWSFQALFISQRVLVLKQFSSHRFSSLHSTQCIGFISMPVLPSGCVRPI